MSDNILNNKLSKLPAPPSLSSSSSSLSSLSSCNNNINTFVLSIYGDMILIDNDNSLKLYWIRSTTTSSSTSSSTSDSYLDLPFDTNDSTSIINTIKSKKYTNILFNNDSTLLLLSSKDDADIVEFVRETDGNIKECKYHQLKGTTTTTTTTATTTIIITSTTRHHHHHHYYNYYYYYYY